MWDKLGYSIDSGDFSNRGYLSLIQKDSATHMRGLAVYMKEDFLLHRFFFLEISANSYLLFSLALLHSVPYFFLHCFVTFVFV